MTKDYSNKNIQGTSFENQDLSNASFADSDLRGVNFTGSNLTAADFSRARTGITLLNTVLIFLVAIIISLFSGYVAMLAGHYVQRMVNSEDGNIRAAGIATLVVVVLFIIYCYWKGSEKVIVHFIIPLILISALIGVLAYVSGLGTGKGMMDLLLAVFLVVIMFVVGTIARTVAGSLSGILFLVVALSGGMFGKSLGGGIGTVVMAVACAMISKRALSGAKGFSGLRKIAAFITRKFGTSFRSSQLSNANFSQTRLRNADFTNADISSVDWGDSKKVNCLTDEIKITVIKN
jgi:hypothetical protein